MDAGRRHRKAEGTAGPSPTRSPLTAFKQAPMLLPASRGQRVSLAMDMRSWDASLTTSSTTRASAWGTRPSRVTASSLNVQAGRWQGEKRHGAVG